MNCLMRAWDRHEAELRGWLRGRLGNAHDAEDMLQDLFLKALRQDRKFCEIANARAWLFEVARNAVADRLRLKKEQVELPDDLVAEHEEPAAVESLAACLPRALSELPEEDREAITRCDLEGMTQEDYARLKGLTLPGAKSRVQRARKRLREHLTEACQVKFDAAGKACCFVPRG
jgi:RNA polymerase sigma-70 factor (ECF subfamily)